VVEPVPVAKTIAVAARPAPYNVTEGGSAVGLGRLRGQRRHARRRNTRRYNVTINASYVIIRGLNLKGAKQDAIRISPTVHDVVIEDNDISGWGRTRDGTWGSDMDSASAACAPRRPDAARDRPAQPHPRSAL
jgi:hypothetical protein